MQSSTREKISCCPLANPIFNKPNAGAAQSNSRISRRTNMHFATRAIAAAVVLLALTAQAHAQGEKIEPSKLPPKVADAVKARFPGATIVQVTKETENGEIVYD